MAGVEKWLGSVKTKQEGFTLVELMVVVAIIGILIATAVPLYGKITGKAEDKVNEANIKIILGAIDMYRAENGFNTEPALEDLEEAYISKGLTPPRSKGNAYKIIYSNDGVPSVTTINDEDNGENG